MGKLTLDEAIKHCLEVAEENDLAAGTYELLAENNHNAYERLTAVTNSSRCAECAADHRQLAEWLTDYKKLNTTYKHISEWNRKLIDHKNDAVCKWGECNEQLKEAKRLLKLAVEDFDMGMTTDDMCNVCKFAFGHCTGEKCTWRYADEALKLIGEKTDGI